MPSLFYHLLLNQSLESTNDSIKSIDTDLGNISKDKLDSLDRTKNYHGLSYIGTGVQAAFIQRGGEFAVQILLGNGVNHIQWRINYGDSWSLYAWHDLT